ncbi:hypothetical protein AUJ84_03360 [Candidatus Pacearchaeota archaeon CG1_02_32_132]|nr:MAG: hypothetical protein AUJ84_03360 [Candidatus Pacearchaeota archaeon CG1_02_32_132]
MTHVKKLTIHGFKSFAPKTEITFGNGINTIVGPNGSGKSNISDALCFVLGRLSAKSLRAQKSKNLLFMGSKYTKPAKEASVELVFDNTNNTFAMPSPEVALARIVRRNGQSIYKINNEVKTRGEVLETLAQAGIDPNGFNIILQGNIQAIVKAHPEERRKIVEEVAGISIYEMRKEKSLKELDKTEERLNEISTILRERTSFMKNLERERADALRFKSLESTVKRCKASILNRKLEEKQKELDGIKNSIQEKIKQKDKIKEQSENAQREIDSLNEKINQINKHIQKSTGIEQETLHSSIANLKADIEGIRVRKENHENRRVEIENRINQLKKSIPDFEREISDLRNKSPLMAKKQEEIKKKKQELSEIQEQKKTVYTLKTQLSALKERLKDKENQLAVLNNESESTLEKLDELSLELKYKDEKQCRESAKVLSAELDKLVLSLDAFGESEIKNEKILSIAESQIQEAEKIKEKVNEIDLCPLCQTKITQEHINHVFQDCDLKKKKSSELIESSKQELIEIKKSRVSLQEKIRELKENISVSEKELARHKSIEEKKAYIKKILEQQDLLKKEVLEFDKKRESLEAKTFDASRIEQDYSDKLREIEEISSRTEENVDASLSFKERELERMHEVIKNSLKDLNSTEESIDDLSSSFEEKSELLEKKEDEEKKLTEKFKQLFKDRDEIQEKVKDIGFKSSELRTSWSQIDDQTNYLKVGNAQLDAQKEAIEMELKEFAGMELIKASQAVLEDKLVKAQDSLNMIGSINLRALEVYDQLKEKYDKVKERSDYIEREKIEVLKIIEEIDKKKKKTFMRTFTAISDLFSENFSRLYTKGRAYLELENKENPFEGGIDIAIKMAKGKYFDITSLSGGEQTMVAISLLFAIQEYKPYHFYIFDEIDAALDKRNSLRLSALLRQYMKNGQYIVITHNDAIITDSNVLYGVSMHEGISKVLSMKLD